MPLSTNLSLAAAARAAMLRTMLGASRLPIASCDVGADSDPVPLAARGALPTPGWLSDAQGRGLRYLRLSVTDRCDLRCTYCMPAEGEPASPREEVLSIEEAIRVVRVFHRLGVRTVRLTGGEPLVRRGLDTLIRAIRHEIGIDDIALTTNGTALGALAARLADAGLARINVSLDSLRPATFAAITRGGELARVLEGIDAARAAGLRVKTNTVVIRGENDDEAEALVRWAWTKDLVPRFIELMPLGAAAALGAARVVPSAELRARLAHLIDEASEPRTDRGPAVYASARDGSGRRVGFIGAVSENFCARCNRVRVTAKGDIRACLASPRGLSLRDLMRAGASDDALEDTIREALFGKGLGHEFAGGDQHRHVAMSRVGG